MRTSVSQPTSTRTAVAILGFVASLALSAMCAGLFVTLWSMPVAQSHDRQHQASLAKWEGVAQAAAAEGLLVRADVPHDSTLRRSAARRLDRALNQWPASSSEASRAQTVRQLTDSLRGAETVTQRETLVRERNRALQDWRMSLATRNTAWRAQWQSLWLRLARFGIIGALGVALWLLWWTASLMPQLGHEEPTDSPWRSS